MFVYFLDIRGMVKAVDGFLIYHAAIGNRLLPDHFNFQSGVGNFFVVNAEHRWLEICQRLVEWFSHPGDWIVDVNIPQGTYCIVLFLLMYFGFSNQYTDINWN